MWSLRHDRHFDACIQDFHVTDGSKEGAHRRFSSTHVPQQRSGGGGPQRQPLRAAAVSRDSGFTHGHESRVLHPDADPKSSSVSAEMSPEPEPRESKGTGYFTFLLLNI